MERSDPDTAITGSTSMNYYTMKSDRSKTKQKSFFFFV